MTLKGQPLKMKHVRMTVIREAFTKKGARNKLIRKVFTMKRARTPMKHT